MTTRQRTARRPGSSTAARPRYTWRYYEVDSTILAPGATVTVDIGAAGSWPSLSALGVFGNYTIRRLVGYVTGQLVSVVELNEFDNIMWGCYVIEADALLASAEAEPNADANDWFAFGTFPIEGRSSGGNSAVHIMNTMTLDNHSMRKVNNNHQTPVMVIQASSLNTSSVRVQTAGRLLVSHGRG